MIVYVVTKGIYSDYHICGVALTKERAEKLAMFYKDAYDDCEIEEYNTEAEDEDMLNRLIPVYSVSIKSDGKYRVNIVSYTDSKVEYKPSFELYKCEGLSFYAKLTAKDPEHAFKIANDKRYKMMSELFKL